MSIYELIKKYLTLSGVNVILTLINGEKIKLQNAIMKENFIINHYYEGKKIKLISLSKIAYVEFSTGDY